MNDPQAGYGLALPDNRQYRGLVQRLPALVWTRLNLTVFFVRRLPDGHEIDVISGDGAQSQANAAHSATNLAGRPRCAACGEPVELDDPNDRDSWIHAPDANDRADHTARIDIERTSR